MMADKHLLSELLKEDQEPFHLKSYIEQRRSLLKEVSPNTKLQLKKSKPIILETRTKRTNLCKHACFLSFQNSPDLRKSPFREFYSPCKSPNGAVFLHIPAGTAALLAEAAMRIQKPQSKPKALGFGLFGSVLKILKDRNKNKKLAVNGVNEDTNSRKNEEEEGKMDVDFSFSCSCNNSRFSSANWSEYHEEKSMDMETSTSSCSRSEDSEIINDSISCENRFCISPFRFSLQTSPSLSRNRTPDFCSPSASPNRHGKQEKESNVTKKVKEVQGEEADEREQCSPVSVLDPPFQDEEDGHESGDAGEDDYDLECCYANVQRTKQQLLYRLRRFEKLAELDSMELERKLLEESHDDDPEEREELEEEEPLMLYKEPSVENFVTEMFNKSSLPNSRKFSSDMTRLVSDLITEEKREMNFWSNKEVVLGRVCNRLDLWKEVEFDTIDMMIELDFKKDSDGWKKMPKQAEETAAEVELAIFGLLVEELSGELGWRHDEMA